MGTIRDGENILGEVFEHTNYGTCSTLASEQIKEVYCPLFRYYIGARISIKFTHGNTAGTCVGTDSNVIDQLQAPKISLNGQIHTIYVGGEPAGEGFINANDVHDFVYDGTNWCDVTADVIYKGGNDTDGYYEKKRNGDITQYYTKTWSSSSSYKTDTFTYPIIYEISTPSVIMSGLLGSFAIDIACVSSISKIQAVFVLAQNVSGHNHGGYSCIVQGK